MYTLVQHTGLRFGLESACVNRKGMCSKVEAAGGVLFETYDEAEEYGMNMQYPTSSETESGWQRLLPHPRGSFGKILIDGRRIYIPWS